MWLGNGTHPQSRSVANASDVGEISKLVRSDDEVVYGDSGYTGAASREEVKRDAHLSQVEFRINLKPSSVEDSATNWASET